MIESIYHDIMSPDVNVAGAVFKLLLSMLLGAAIGFERRRKGQIAGLRTFSLIAMGATLAMLISIYIPQEYLGLKNGDPGRIAAQVVSGVGFLGAGAIIQMKGSVRGLTTAAGIWMTACIGLAVGAGMYLITTIATLLIIFVLVYIEKYEQHAGFLWEHKVIRVKYEYENNVSIINYVVLTRDTVSVTDLFSELEACFSDPISITLTNEPNF